MELTSTSITEGEPIDLKYAEPMCNGENVVPQLAWTSGPDGTKSYAITIYDPDAPTGSGWWHWVAANIPLDVTIVEENGQLPPSALQADNDYGYAGYGGPCPPPGPAHRYEHTVYALDVEQLPLPDDPSCAVVRMMIMGHSLASATITATYAQPED